MPRYTQRPQQGVGIAYTPQYDPGFYETAGNMLQQAQQQYDMTTAAQAESMAQYGQEFSFDPELRDEMIGKYKESLSSIVEDYGGDVGAARNKIVRRMGEEAVNPFWQANKYQVEQAKIAQQLEAQYGPGNTLWINDPRNPDALRKAVASGDMSVLEARAAKAPDYVGIGSQLMSNIAADLRSEGYSIEQIGGILNTLRSGQIQEITNSRVKEIAEASLDAFKAATPERQFDNREGYEWTQDDASIIEFLADLGQKQIFSKRQVDMKPLTNEQLGIDMTPNTPGGYSPQRALGAQIETSRRQIDNKYKSQLKNIETVLNTTSQISANPVTASEKVLPSTNKDLLKFVDNAKKDPIELNEILELAGGLTKPFIVQGEDGLLKLNSNYNTSADPHITHLSPEAAVVDALRSQSNQLITAETRLADRKEQVTTFLNENKAVDDIATSIGAYNDDGTINWGKLPEALEIAQEFEKNQAVQHFVAEKITSSESRTGIIDALSGYVGPDKARIEWGNTKKSGRYKERKEDTGGIELLNTVGVKESDTMEYIPSTGEIKISISDRGVSKHVYIPANVLYNTENSVVSSTQKLLGSIRKLDGPIDEWSANEEDVIKYIETGEISDGLFLVAGVPVRHIKFLKDNKLHAAVQWINPYAPKKGFQNISLQMLTKHAANALHMGTAYDRDIRSEVDDSFRQ